MVLLRSTVGLCLLMIIAFPEAKSLSCESTCVSGTTTDKGEVEFKCETPSTGENSPELTWDLNPLGSPDIPEQQQVGEVIRRDFTWKVVEHVPELSCTDGGETPCKVHACNILYSPRNVVTSPQYSVSPGENITCTAEGDPELTFKWEENVDGSWTDVDGADGETITAELKDGAYYTELRCVATNSVSSEYSASVYVSKYGSSIRTIIIVCVVVGVVVVGVISGVVYKFKGGSSG